jgi:hypothetical protein
VSSLVFCVTVLYGQHSQGLAAFWAADVGPVCLAGATAAAAVLLTSCLVLPSAASEQVREGINILAADPQRSHDFVCRTV